MIAAITFSWDAINASAKFGVSELESRSRTSNESNTESVFATRCVKHTY